MMTSREFSDSALMISSSWRWAIDMPATLRVRPEVDLQALQQRLHVGAQARAVDQAERPARAARGR